jgi:quercetin dioxygenase-like cupin family protein
MKAGSRIAEHQAEGSATIHALSGHVRLRLPERTVELAAGSILSLPPGLRHDVEAAADSALVVTFGWRATP